MKLFQIVSILTLIVSLLSFVPKANATIQYYGADVDLGADGNAKIKLIITFTQPVKEFQLTILGNIRNFDSSSNSGPVFCDTTVGAASIIDCKMNLTDDKRTLELSFQSSDVVKKVDKDNLFSLDLSLSQDITGAAATVRLPEGFALANTTSLPATMPDASNIASDGRRIIVNWNYGNLTSGQSFKFQTLYEPVETQSQTTFIAISSLILIVVFGGIFFFYRKMRHPKEVILSVLDDFEKSVIEVISKAGGETTQKKVVIETNLSKAKVSRVINKLQERGLIEVKRLGRTNRLKLVKKFFEGN